MSDIKAALQQCDDKTKTVGNILIDFYERMQKLELDRERGGKQATLIIMTIKDITDICICKL